MFAVPGLEGTTAVALVALGALTGLVAALLFVRRARAACPGQPVAVAVSALAAATAVAAAPFGAWRIVEDLRATTRLERGVAERIAAYQHYMDGTLYDRAAAAMLPGDTYFAHASREVPDEVSRTVFRWYALDRLLPRRAVLRPERADWLLLWGGDPRGFGVPVEEVRTIAEPRNGFPAAYLARVRR